MLVQDAAHSHSDLHSLRDALDRATANLSMDALLILDLINVHAFDCFDPAAFDYAAVARLCTRAAIRIPNE